MSDPQTNREALSVQAGVQQQPAVNPNYAVRRKRLPGAETFIDGIRSGNRVMLGRAITLVESTVPAHQQLASEIINALLPASGRSLRIGITGVPGVGKSTFIEALGVQLVDRGHRLAVLAIDPSSEASRGSILGDKTRMEQLATRNQAFIRPSPTRGALGGVARATREAIILCEAAGFDVIFVETVGVGQSETEVYNLTDFFLLLMLPGAGDDLQGIKRGIIERADAMVITKADGSNMDRVRQARSDYRLALHHLPPSASGFARKVLTCSAYEGNGLDTVWETIEEYAQLTQANGYFERRRNQQALHALHRHVRYQLEHRFYQEPRLQDALAVAESEVLNGITSPWAASDALMQAFLETLRD